MKRIKHILALIFASVMVIAGGLQAKAEQYTYRVTLLPGLYGTVDGTYFDVPYKETVTLSVDEDADGNIVASASYGGTTYTVTVNGDVKNKYYCRGFHVSGIEPVVVGSLPITKDTILVASYGMKSKAVKYTVKFVDEDGNELAESKTFYGNIGDKPVVSCEYIEGWVPDALQKTGTLVDPSSQEGEANVFPFIYHPAEAIPGGGGGGTTGEGGYTFIDDGTEVVYLPGGGGGGGGNAGGNAGGGNAGGNAAPAADNANAQDAATAADAGNDGPAEIIDLDEQEVPLVNPDTPEPEVSPSVNPKPGLNFMWILAMILSGFGIIALIAILILLLKRRKKEQPQA